MINQEKLATIIAAYKVYFPEHWSDEKYKWQAIKYFQEHWDIQSTDFAKMLETATEKTNNLLSSSYFFPRGMILAFAKADPEATRAMFLNLYDETKTLAERVDAFQASSDQLREKYNDGTWKMHYQNTNAISTYLWLRFPDQYYIYKYSDDVSVAKKLDSDFIPKRKGTSSEMISVFKMYKLYPVKRTRERVAFEPTSPVNGR